MKLLNPRGNMIKMNFRTAKSGQNITNSLSLTDWNASRSSRRTEVQGRGRVLTEVWTWNFGFSVFPEFKKLIIKIKFGLWESLQLARYLCKSIVMPPLHESSDTGSCKNHASRGRAGSSLPSSARGGKWDNSQSQGGSPLHCSLCEKQLQTALSTCAEDQSPSEKSALEGGQSPGTARRQPDPLFPQESILF